MKELISLGMTVIDVGANIGFYTAFMVANTTTISLFRGFRYADILIIMFLHLFSHNKRYFFRIQKSFPLFDFETNIFYNFCY